MTFFEKWNHLTQQLETSLADNIASTTPWLAPVIPAWLAYHNMTVVMNFPFVVAFIGATVVECLGLATITTAVQFWDWNDKKRISDQAAPIKISIATASFYLLVVLTVNVLLDGAPLLHRLAKLLLSVLGVVGAVTVAIRSQHRRRVDEIEAQKREKRRERQDKRRVVDEIVTSSDELPDLAGKYDWRLLSTEEVEKIRGLSVQEIVKMHPGMKERTARDWRRRANKPLF